MFKQSKSNPHDQDENYFASYCWESTMGAKVLSNHYSSYEAARYYLDNTYDQQTRDFYIGKPPPKHDKVVVEDEQGVYWYFPKIDEVV